jgi:hypothetical protein
VGKGCVGGIAAHDGTPFGYVFRNDVPFLSPQHLHNRQRLAIHAKRITIFPKDTDLLRDIIFAFDPENGLGRPSAERNETWDRHRAAEKKRLKQKMAAATARADRIIAGGGTVPAPLKRFAGTRQTANRTRRAGRKGG